MTTDAGERLEASRRRVVEPDEEQGHRRRRRPARRRPPPGPRSWRAAAPARAPSSSLVDPLRGKRGQRPPRVEQSVGGAHEQREQRHACRDEHGERRHGEPGEVEAGVVVEAARWPADRPRGRPGWRVRRRRRTARPRPGRRSADRRGGAGSRASARRPPPGEHAGAGQHEPWPAGEGGEQQADHHHQQERQDRGVIVDAQRAWRRCRPRSARGRRPAPRGSRATRLGRAGRDCGRRAARRPRGRGSPRRRAHRPARRSGTSTAHATTSSASGVSSSRAASGGRTPTISHRTT